MFGRLQDLRQVCGMGGLRVLSLSANFEGLRDGGADRCRRRVVRKVGQMRKDGNHG